MGVKFEWETSDHNVMYCLIEYPWTWQEYQTMLDVLTAELRRETHPVATIVDVTQMKSFPPNENVMQNLRRVDTLMPDNVFGSVMVGAPHVLVTFINILIQIRPKTRRIAMFANTLEEAHGLLEERYQSLYSRPDHRPSKAG
jgi:hypothetical protein